MTSRERDLMNQIYREWNSSPPYATRKDIEEVFRDECENEYVIWLKYTDMKSFEEPLCKKGLT